MVLTKTRQQQIANRNYNRERRKIAEWIMEDVDQEQLMKGIHQAAAERVGNMIDEFYRRYAGREGLSVEEAKKKASAFDVTQYFDKARQAVAEKDFSPEANEWLRTYNLKMRTSRLEVLKAEINLELLTMYDEEEGLIEQSLLDEVEDEMARQRDIIRENKEQAGILGNSVVSPSQDYRNIVKADFYGADFSERIWGRTGHYQEMQRDVFKSLGNIFTDMMGYRQERDRLMAKFHTSENEAMRLLKTEMARVRADSQIESGKANGFTHAIYVAEPTACDVCADLDGTAIPLDDIRVGENFYPMHPNCKCSSYMQTKMDYVDGGTNLDDYKDYEP